jgi:hypothetical protein
MLAQQHAATRSNPQHHAQRMDHLQSLFASATLADAAGIGTAANARLPATASVRARVGVMAARPAAIAPCTPRSARGNNCIAILWSKLVLGCLYCPLICSSRWLWLMRGSSVMRRIFQRTPRITR